MPVYRKYRGHRNMLKDTTGVRLAKSKVWKTAQEK